MNVIMVGANNPEVIRLIRDWEDDKSDYIDERNVTGFIDNDKSLWGKHFYGYPIFSGFEVLSRLVEEYLFVNLITGSTAVRKRTSDTIYNSCGMFANFIHPSVDLRMVTTAGSKGIYIQDHVIVQAGCHIEFNVAIHTGAIVAHECTIGAHSFIAHGACISGKVEIGEGVFVGANATILPRLKIGKWSTIGAGAVVTKDVEDYAVMVGNPARVIR